MQELIDKQKLYDYIQKEKAWKQSTAKQPRYEQGLRDAYYEVLDIIKAQPAVDTEKHAYWIDVTTEDDDEPLFKCSNCGNKGGQWNYNCDYCPDCGYKMEKVKENNNIE